MRLPQRELLPLLVATLQSRPQFKHVTPAEKLFLSRIIVDDVKPEWRDFSLLTPIHVASYKLAEIDVLWIKKVTDDLTKHLRDNQLVEPFKLSITQEPKEGLSVEEAKEACCRLLQDYIWDPSVLQEKDSLMLQKARQAVVIPNSVWGSFDWIHPPLFHHTEYEESSKGPRLSTQQRDEMRKTMIYGYSSPLSPSQQESLIEALYSFPEFIHCVSMSPQNFVSLVDQNPIVAVEALIQLEYSTDFEKYLEVLLDAYMSLQSMDIINRVAMIDETIIPQDFLHLYISKCTSYCDVIKDKYIQNRHVRLVCVLLQSLLRARAILLSDYLVEIKTFCLAFSRVKEAAGLYRLVVGSTK